MDIALRKYYENRIAMMGDVAWKQLVEDVQEMLTVANRLDGIKDEATLHFRRGELNMMRWVLSLEEVSRGAYDELQRQGGDDAAIEGL